MRWPHPVAVDDASNRSKAAPAADLTVDADVESALRGLSRPGERALGLLQHAALVLSDLTRYTAAVEVAAASCRGALEILLNMAPASLPGLQSATRKAVRSAKAVVEVWRTADPALAGQLEELAISVAELAKEENDPGGYRIRRVERRRAGSDGVPWSGVAGIFV